MKTGIDISSYQRNVDYDQVAENIDFAILRVGYGVTYLPSTQKDSQFENHYDGLYGKVPVGAYYYAYANAIGEGRQEAENCLRYLDGKSLDMPIYYDLEDSSMRYIPEVAREFVDTIKEAGYEAGIYCNMNWARNKINLDDFQDCSIWIAMYGNNDGSIPSDEPPINYDIWQYTSNGSVEGINGRVDMNLMEGESPVPPTPPEPPTPSGDEQIREIQDWCNSYGLDIVVDGYYGPETHSALVKVYQIELNEQFGAGLDVDGIFGPATKAAAIIVRQGAEGNITQDIQSVLYCKGFDPNGIDGIYGTGTTKAVKKFQRKNGLTADGVVGPETAYELFY